MAEYIERAAIKYEQWAVGPLCEPLMVVRKKTVDSIPPADVVEVVRCKDCKYRSGLNGRAPFMFYICTCAEGLAGAVRENNFCSYGERRADDG